MIGAESPQVCANLPRPRPVGRGADRGDNPAAPQVHHRLDPNTGARRRASFYGPTAKAVRDKLKTARERFGAEAPVKDATRTVGDWLAHWRATTLAVSDRKESTRVLYANLCRQHLEPAPFGAVPLDRLRPTNIEALVLSKRAKTLSDSTIRKVYMVPRAGLDGAVRDGLLGP